MLAPSRRTSRALSLVPVCLASALAAVVTSLAPPAVAQTFTHHDALQDVRFYHYSSTTAHRDPSFRQADVRAVTIKHTARKITVAATLRSVSMKSLSYRAMDVVLRTSNGHGTWTFSYQHQSDGDYVLISHGTASPKCGTGAHESAKTRTMTLSLPTSCVGKPRWVRATVDVYVSQRGTNTVFHDDALTRKWDLYHLAWSPRIRQA